MRTLNICAVDAFVAVRVIEEDGRELTRNTFSPGAQTYLRHALGIARAPKSPLTRVGNAPGHRGVFIEITARGGSDPRISYRSHSVDGTPRRWHSLAGAQFDELERALNDAEAFRQRGTPHAPPTPDAAT